MTASKVRDLLPASGKRQPLYDIEFVCAPVPTAQKVFLIGDFNNWSPTSSPMRKKGSVFRLALRLQSGQYAYKFLIDGEEHLDPTAKLQEWAGPLDIRSIVRVPPIRPR